MKKSALRFLLLVLALSLLGLFFVFDASTVESFKLFGHPYHFASQQALWLLVALVIASVAYFFNLEIWRRLALPLYLLGLIGLFLPLIPGIGLRLNGASRWVSLFGYSFQPVEFFKFCFINFYAHYLSKNQHWWGFLFFLLWPSIILLIQPDFGSLLIILGSAMVMYFLSGVKWQTFLTLALAALLISVASVLLIPYRRQRLMTFFSQGENLQTEGYHTHQVLLALGSGSWLGRGIGNSQQKYAYVPEASSDSIFAIIAEELGFVGSSVILLLLLTYFVLARQMIKDVKLTDYQYLLFYGILAWIALQMILNLGAVVAILPLSGMPLPFFSQGGSALVSILLASAILLNISKSQS